MHTRISLSGDLSPTNYYASSGGCFFFIRFSSQVCIAPKEKLQQWFSALLMLPLFNAIPHVVGIPNHKLFHCYFVAVILLLL